MRPRRFDFSKRPAQQESESQNQPLKDSDLPWREWLFVKFPHLDLADFAERHVNLWDWFDALERGVRPDPRIEVWARGGAKSSSAELGVCRVGAKLTRRFCLYVSETQAQAAKHVAAIASLFESMGVERAVNPYGASKGWSRDMIRTANGFNVAAFGLDVAQRGVKLDHYRPDLILLDDIDNSLDTIATVEKKILALTGAILPTGSVDCAVLGVQNLIHDESIFSRLVDDRADFLMDRTIPTVEPALYDFEWRLRTRDDGKNEYEITAGRPSWVGQGLKKCQDDLNLVGIDAFLREYQHLTRRGKGHFFDADKMLTVRPEEVPDLVSLCLAGDLAATENGGDHTVLVLLGKAQNETYYVLCVVRGQWGEDRVESVIEITRNHFKRIYPKLKFRLPQDPGAAGKILAGHMRRDTPDAAIRPMSGSKATRAKASAGEVNRGNVFLVANDVPDCLKDFVKSTAWGVWQHAFKRVLRNFREDLTKQEDDDVDALSDSYNELAGPRRQWDNLIV